MSKISKQILTVLVILGFVGTSMGIYLYNKPHIDLANQQADISFAASKLFSEFETDENSANKKYLNKIIEVRGNIQEITKTDDGGLIIVLRGEEDIFGVNCAFEKKDAQKIVGIKTGKEITVKGFCTGMLMDVNLSRCVLVKG